MGHLTLYRADMDRVSWETEKYSSGLGRLPDARDPLTKRVVNGDWSFSMKYPINGSNVEALQQQRLICAEGQLYRINGLRKIDTLDGRAWEVTAEHIMYDLRDAAEITNIETVENPATEAGITQEAALELILAGTGFVVGIVDDTQTMDHLEILQKSPFAALKEQVLGHWGGELWPDNWTINILSQGGQDRHHPIRRGRNLKGISYNESTRDVVTRLHVSGYGGATFEEINDGKDYIDSPNMSLYPFPKHGRVEFNDEDDPAVLLDMAQAHISTVDVPQVAYDIELTMLRKTPYWHLYAPLEVYDLGDSAVIHHDFFATDIIARAMEIDRDPVRETAMRVVLGNYKEDLFSTLSDSRRAADIVNTIVNRNGSLRGDKLRGTIDLLTTQLKASGSYANATVLNGQGFLLENTDTASPDYGAMYLGCGIFSIANAKNSDNSWSWSTFGTPSGFAGQYLLAESITASKLAADVAESLELSSNLSIQSVVQAAVNAEYSALQAYALTLVTNKDWTVEIGQAKQAAVEIANGELDTFTAWIRGWMSYDGMTLSLGRSDSVYKTEITNTRMAFTYMGTTLAYFAGDRLVVPWAELEKVTMMARNTSGVPTYYLDIQFDGTSYSGTLRG